MGYIRKNVGQKSGTFVLQYKNNFRFIWITVYKPCSLRLNYVVIFEEKTFEAVSQGSGEFFHDFINS